MSHEAWRCEARGDDLQAIEEMLGMALLAFRALKPREGAGQGPSLPERELADLEAAEARYAKGEAAGAGEATQTAACLRLWAESEAAARAKDFARLARMSDWARLTVSRIASRSALRSDAKGPWGSAVGLAIAYGALASYRNAANDELAAGALPRLRADFFRDFMEGGRLRSKAGAEGALPSIVLCAVPFCVIDAGNVLMVETVASLRSSRSTRDAALLCWYYAERGDLEASTSLAEEARRGLEGGADPIARCALELAAARALGAAGDEAAPDSWHEPEGDGSLYRFQRKARIPAFPAGGERVLLRARFSPSQASLRAFAVVDSRAGRREIEMRSVRLDGRESYREADIGAFQNGERVRYRIVLESGEGRLEGPEHSFAALYRERITSAQALGDGSYTLRSAAGSEGTHARGSRAEGAAYARIERTAGGIALRVSSSPFPADRDPARDSGAAAPVDRAGASLELGPEATPRFALGDTTLVKGFSGLGLSALELDLGEEGSLRALRLRLRASPGERFYGSGERFASVEHSGRSLDSYVFNQYCGQGDRSYIPIPFFTSSAGYGLRVSARGSAALGFDSVGLGYVELELEAEEGAAAGFTFYAGSPYEALAAYLSDVGLPALPPRWAFGPWMSSNNWDSQELSLEQVRITRELGIPATVLVLEQWSDEATFYVWNDAVYDRKAGSEPFSLSDFRFPASGRWPDPKAMVAEMHREGLRVLLWQAPVMRYMDGVPHAQRDEDERYMIEKGFCLVRADGSPYRIPDFEWFKRSLVPDFSKPEARDWWLAKRAYLVDEIGIDGIKTDGGECVYGPGAREGSGRSGNELRNAYPVEYEGAFHAWLRAKRDGDAMTFSRSGFEGSQAHPAHWAGDERSTFEAFRASVRAGINAGLSGLPFWGWDFAGFSGDVPSAELYLRAASMAALCPIMQYHAESRGEECRDRTPWNIASRCGDPSVIDYYRDLARLRMNLIPYLWAEAERGSRTGAPMMRALFAEYPGEAWLGQVDDEYLLGPSILVAPIVHEGASSREVALPPGGWTPLLGGGRIEGGRILDMAAPLRSPLCGTVALLRDDHVVSLNLPADFAFPGDVGNSVDGYTRLCFLASARAGFEYEYERYDGARVELAAKTASGVCVVEAENGGEEPVWVALGEHRRFLEAPPGRSTLEFPVEW